MNPDLSIVIVNYNVKHFVIKCLESIYKSEHKNFSYEVIIVDNASVDGSTAAIIHDFPDVFLIHNQLNVGFAKANNQGFSNATGKYILCLNPDTILQEDTLSICYEYMESHTSCGVLGVMMIDGKGAYLPESKRGLPTVWNSFCKFSGLISLFPTSQIFSGYYMGFKNKDSIHEVEVLCGAFMFFNSEALKKAGGFDERYFMYGEDIDLSLQIGKLGYAVIYLPTTRIIHFKGESSKKASFNYIKNFYNAMLIYVSKNYTGWNGLSMKIFIKLGIYFSAIASFLKYNIASNILMILDGFILLFSMGFFRKLWGKFYFDNAEYYNNDIALFNDIGYTLTLLTTLWFFGHYDKNYRVKRTITAVFAATLIALIFYSLLPTDWRSSRFVLVLSSLLSLLLVYITHKCWKLLKQTLIKQEGENYLIVANKKNSEKIQSIILNSHQDAKIIGVVNPQTITDHVDIDYLCDLNQLADVAKMMKADYIIFSNEDMSLQNILDHMIVSDKDVKYLITGSEAHAVIGSSDYASKKNLYFAESSYKLSAAFYLRIKRLFDLASSCVVVLCIPIFYLSRTNNKRTIIDNVLNVIFGKMTWFGYIECNTNHNLPALKKAVFDIHHLVGNTEYFPVMVSDHDANLFYAKLYTVYIDIKLFLQKLRHDES